MSTTTRVFEDFKDTWDDHIKRLHTSIVDGYWNTREYRLKFGEKGEDFKHTQKSAEDLLEALQVLLKHG